MRARSPSPVCGPPSSLVSEADLSLVIPAYDEAENLPVLAAEIREALRSSRWSYEVLVVDDGSSDATPEILARLAQRELGFRALRLEHNCGQSAALVAGFLRARGRIVVTLDADLQNDPADIPKVVAALESTGADAVSGVRTNRHDAWLRRLSSRIANGVRRRVLRDGITDVGCSLKAYRREVVAGLPCFDGMHRFLPALVQLRGGRVLEVPVGHRPRLHGSPKYGVHNRLWRGIADLMAVRWMQERWISHQDVEATSTRTSRHFGWSLDSPNRPPSAAASSFNGSLLNADDGASSAPLEATKCAES